MDRAAAEDWIRAHVNPDGADRDHARETLGDSLRVPLAGGLVWFKACRLAQAFEACRWTPESGSSANPVNLVWTTTRCAARAHYPTTLCVPGSISPKARKSRLWVCPDGSVKALGSCDATVEERAAPYYRHFRMGVCHADGRLKPAAKRLAAWAPRGGGCASGSTGEHGRLERMARLLDELGIRRVRTGIGWADWDRPGPPSGSIRSWTVWRLSTRP
jgi:hypothetical protein